MQGAAPRMGCWNTLHATDQQDRPLRQGSSCPQQGPYQDLHAACPWLRMQLMQAVFIQGMYSCNYRHDVMITGNPCPVEMQAEKGTHGAIC